MILLSVVFIIPIYYSARSKGYPAGFFAVVAGVMAFIALLLSAEFLGPAFGILWLVLPAAVLGVVFTAGAHTLFIEGLRSVRAQTAAVISSLEPVYGIVLAALFLGEVPAVRTLAGGLVILAAALAATRSAARTG